MTIGRNEDKLVSPAGGGFLVSSKVPSNIEEQNDMQSVDFEVVNTSSKVTPQQSISVGEPYRSDYCDKDKVYRTKMSRDIYQGKIWSRFGIPCAKQRIMIAMSRRD
jgi:hypothetical protein